MSEELTYGEKYSPVGEFAGAEINENDPEQGPVAEKQLKAFIADILKNALETEQSINYTSGCIQKKVAHDSALIELAMISIAELFLCSDNIFRRNTFYVINNLVQYDTRFRLAVFRDLIPEVAPCIASLSDNSVYMKTVATWEQRNIYPYEICKTIETAFQSVDAAKKITTEYEQRLNSFIEILRTRSAKDETLRKLIYDGDDKEALTASILSAETNELQEMKTMLQGVILTTQNTIGYLSRLIQDCKSNYGDFHELSFISLQNIINKIDNI